jgi:hypothetical protein
MAGTGERESGLGHSRSEPLRVPFELVSEMVTRLQELEDLHRGGSDGRRQRVAEQVRPGALAQSGPLDGETCSAVGSATSSSHAPRPTTTRSCGEVSAGATPPTHSRSCLSRHDCPPEDRFEPLRSCPQPLSWTFANDDVGGDYHGVHVSRSPPVPTISNVQVVGGREPSLNAPSVSLA